MGCIVITSPLRLRPLGRTAGSGLRRSGGAEGGQEKQGTQRRHGRYFAGALVEKPGSSLDGSLAKGHIGRHAGHKCDRNHENGKDA
jgi:hypothetical protein